MTILRAALTGGIVAALLVSAACSGVHGSPDAVTALEQKSVDALNLKSRYKDVVMGTDIKGQTLDLYVDVNNLYSMDETAEDAMLDQTLVSWKRIWGRNHPHDRKALKLSVRDFYGNEVASRSTHT